MHRHVNMIKMLPFFMRFNFRKSYLKYEHTETGRQHLEELRSHATMDRINLFELLIKSDKRIRIRVKMIHFSAQTMHKHHHGGIRKNIKI